MAKKKTAVQTLAPTEIKVGQKTDHLPEGWQHGDVVKIPLASIVPNNWNPNEMTAADFNMLSENIDEVDFLDPLLVVPLNDGTFRIIDGEHRYESERLRDVESVQCVLADPERIPEHKQKFQTVRMNKIKGKLNQKKFSALVTDLMKSGQYSYDELAHQFGFTDESEFEHLIAATRDSLPSDEMKKDFDKAKDEIKTVDDLSAVLNSLFCYDAETETLTDHGWIKYHEFEQGMLVATLSLDTGEIFFQKPTALHVFPVESEQVYRVSGKATDLLVTSGHRMLYKPCNGSTCDGWEVKPIEDMLKDHAAFEFVKRVGGYRALTTLPEFVNLPGASGSKIPLADFIELIGWYVSEGNIKRGRGKPALCVTQNLGAKFDSIQDLFNRFEGFGFGVWGPHVYDGTAKLYIKDDAIVSWFSENLGEGSSNKKIPNFLLWMPRDMLHLLFMTLMRGDGCWREFGEYGSYFSNSKSLADSVQIMAFLLGYKAYVFGAGGGWTVSITRGAPNSKLLRGNFSKESYTGIVYCFEMPEGLFVVRRHGKISVHGNTKYGDTMPYNFMILDFGKKDHLWVRMPSSSYKKVVAQARSCVEANVTFDSLLLKVLSMLDVKKFAEKWKDSLEEPQKGEDVPGIDELTEVSDE